MHNIDFSQTPFPWTTATEDGSIGNVYAANGQQVIQVQHIPLKPRGHGGQEVRHRTALTQWVALACDSHDALVAQVKELANAIDSCGAAVVPLSPKVEKARRLLAQIEGLTPASDEPSMGL